MNVARVYGLTVPPEVVFDDLTDPARLDRWLPGNVRGEPAGPGRIRVHAGGTHLDCVVAADPAKMQIRWQLAGRTDVRGTAELTDGPAGGAELRVLVEAPDTVLDPARTGAFIDDAVHRLQRDVEDNLNAG